MRLIVAAVQLTSRADVVANLARSAELIDRAAGRGAELIVLPENFALVGTSEEAKFTIAEALPAPPGEGETGGEMEVREAAPPGPILSMLMERARAHRAWIVGGGMPERTGEPERVHNTCVLIAPDGHLAAAYRKIHLFDVLTSDGVAYHESKTVAAGNAPVVAETPWGGLGLSVCYDLRFPELYRRLSAAGARILVVPAAFTVPTGRDHWHVLLRARAVENQAFVVAAAQWGRHNEKRITYGHSLIADPWGTVLAEAPDGEGYALAELDLDRQNQIRRDLPALTHRVL